MKKFLATLIIATLCVSFTACGGNNSNAADNGTNNSENTSVEAPADTVADTVGTKLAADFKSQVAANDSASALEIADAILMNEVINFGGASMEVEPGLLNGFNNAEITGFSEGAMFAPMIGSIPFVGYIFTLEDGTDVAAFMDNLKTNADLRWNICTEADEMVVENAGNKVFFVMCPTNFDEEM